MGAFTGRYSVHVQLEFTLKFSWVVATPYRYPVCPLHTFS